MHRIIIYPLALMMLSVSQPACAQQSPNVGVETTAVDLAQVTPIIARVKAAYGGEKLENLKSLRVQTDRGLAWPGQGQTADFVEFISDISDFQVDLINERASRERWVSQNGGIYLTRQVSAPDGGVAYINYNTGTFELHEEGKFHRSFGVELTGTDTLIAYALVKGADVTALEEPVYYLGKWHDRIKMKIAPTNPESTAYIERDTGLIRRFEVKLQNDSWNAIFDHYETSNGITYARERMDYRNDEMVQIDPNRRHTFNNVRWSKLKLEDDLVSTPEEVDISKMTVEHMTPSIHHAGQEDYSTFIDAGDYIIGINPYDGLKDRFKAYQDDRGHAKPLRYVLATHHHRDHISGVSEAEELGAIIVGTPMTIKILKADDAHKAAKLQTLAIRDSIGPIQTYTIATSHAAEYALIYIPEGKVLYQDDHYNADLVGGPSHVNQNGLELQKRVNELGLDVKIILSGHARKAETWIDFEKSATKETLGDICPRNREICRDQ
ncbi:MAG: MBL fold metallo-hydrolase [Hellea sp.]